MSSHSHELVDPNDQLRALAALAQKLAQEAQKQAEQARETKEPAPAPEPVLAATPKGPGPASQSQPQQAKPSAIKAPTKAPVSTRMNIRERARAALEQADKARTQESKPAPETPQPKPVQAVQEIQPLPKPAQETKPQQKPVQDTRTQQKPVQEAKPQPKPVQEAKPQPKPVQETKPQPKPAQEAKPQEKPVQETKPQAKPVQETKPQPKPVQEAKPPAKEQKVSALEQKATEKPVSLDSQVDKESKAQTKTEAKPQTKSTQEPKPQSKPAQEPKPQSKPAQESKPQTQPKQTKEQASSTLEQKATEKPVSLDSTVSKEAEKEAKQPAQVKILHADTSDQAKLVIKGVEIANKQPKKNDKKLADKIEVRYVNPKVEEQTGLPLRKFNLNYLFAKKDVRDLRFSSVYGYPDTKFLPPKVELRSHFDTVLDQEDLGSCVSNSVAYAVRYCFKKDSLGNFDPSRLFIYYNGRVVSDSPVEEDTGLTVRDGYKSVAHYSVCSEANWPYDVSKFHIKPPPHCYEAAKQHKTFRYIALRQDINLFKKCLKDQFPISFGAALFESFMSPEVATTGMVPMPDVDKDERIGGHAMLIVGYNDDIKRFTVLNSWSPSWGDKGFCYIPYDYICDDDLCGDFWTPRVFS